MSRLVDFYRGQATDTEGRFLKDIWAWDDDSLESVHDFIQWLFPLPEPSQFNPDAPLLSTEDIAAFQRDALLGANLQKSFERLLTFLGLARNPDGGVTEGANFAARKPEVWAAPNHNWLRITRILRSLYLLGQAAEAQALFACLNTFYQSRKFPIRDSTFRYWSAAIRAGI
jgi:hypothetical protein